jgi:hypothetical protein
MTSTATTVEAYLRNLPEDRQEAVGKIITSLNKSLPKGFEASMQYGMVTFVVPHKTYPSGYHCNPKDALPFISVASQKNFIALYHMGMYANKEVLDWFTAEYPKHTKAKLDMGKSCVRFKKPDDIPFKLIEALAKKITVKEWIATYEKQFKKAK